MLALGVTGGIGMGKSTAGEMLEELGVPVIDTDKVARDLTRPGMPATVRIAAEFGADVVSSAGELRRDVMAAIVFADDAKRRMLEEILHPRIEAEWVARLQEWAAAGRVVGAVLIPLLFEKAYESRFDGVVCVWCTGETQHQRLRARGWTSEAIAARNQSQLDPATKANRSDYVVWTEGAIASHRRQWEILLGSLRRQDEPRLGPR